MSTLTRTMTRAERLRRLDDARRALDSARSALAHGRYVTYARKTLAAMGYLLPVAMDAEQVEKKPAGDITLEGGDRDGH